MSYTRKTQRIDYQNPPLVESIFELRFLPQEPDPLFPGKLHAALGKYYPNVEVLHNAGLAGGELSLPVVRFSNHNRDLMLQYGPGLLSLVASRPYIGYDKFRRTVKKVVEMLVSIVPDLVVQRLGLRNVNLFSFPDAEVNVNDFFDLALQFPDQLHEWSIQLFAVTIVLDPPNSSRSVRLNVRSQSRGEELGIVLDLDCFQEPDDGVDDIMTWLEESHDILGDAFESSITQQARALLRPKHDEWQSS